MARRDAVSQIRRYEQGTAQPTLDVIRRLALALNTSADQLIFDPEDRAPTNDWQLRLELRPEEMRCRLKNLVGAPQLADLRLQVLQPLPISSRQTGLLTSIDIGLLDPLTHRLDTEVELARDALHRPVTTAPSRARRTSRIACSSCCSVYRRVVAGLLCDDMTLSMLQR